MWELGSLNRPEKQTPHFYAKSHTEMWQVKLTKVFFCSPSHHKHNRWNFPSYRDWKISAVWHCTTVAAGFPRALFHGWSLPWVPGSAPRVGGLLQPPLASQHPCSHPATAAPGSQLPQLSLTHMGRQHSLGRSLQGIVCSLATPSELS